MPDPESLRDSTQIVVPCDALNGLRSDLEAEFAVTVFSTDDVDCRIIGSPIEIKEVSDFLARDGVNIA
ncbi:hypothetical protein ACFQJD_04940 [Haloplanus sp. GCM10025708]|uniref:VNG_1110C family protein n=1 Tax=Haloferacaceae TaxID=1644056 RepID=UPI00361D8042